MAVVRRGYDSGDPSPLPPLLHSFSNAHTFHSQVHFLQGKKLGSDGAIVSPYIRFEGVVSTTGRPRALVMPGKVLRKTA